MRNEKNQILSVEEALRQAVCPLCPPDLDWVERVCRRIAREAVVAREAVTRRSGHILNPLLRVAAVLLLLAGAAVFSRLPARDEGASVITYANHASLRDQMGAFTDTRLLTQALSVESRNIIADLEMLAKAIKDKALAIMI